MSSFNHKTEKGKSINERLFDKERRYATPWLCVDVLCLKKIWSSLFLLVLNQNMVFYQNEATIAVLTLSDDSYNVKSFECFTSCI